MQAQHAPGRHEELCVPRGNPAQVATGPTGHGHCDIGRRAKGRSALAHQQHRRKLEGVDAHKAVRRGVVERRAREGDGAVQRGVGQLEGLAAAGEELGGEQAGIGQGGAFVSGGGVGRRGARDDSGRGRELDCGVCSLLRGRGGGGAGLRDVRVATRHRKWQEGGLTCSCNITWAPLSTGPNKQPCAPP